MFTVKMQFEKETKGAIRFKELEVPQFEEPKIGTLYIRRSTFKELGRIPSVINVSVEVER